MRLAHREHLNAVNLASDDATRYAITGVQFTETEKGLRAVATDGKRLAVVESEIRGGFAAEDFPVVPGMDAAPNTAKTAIIPSESVKAALKSLPKKCKLPVLNTALLKMGETQSTIATTDLSNASVMPTRHIEGTFPAWENVLPKGEPIFKIGMSTQLLIETLQLAKANGGEVVALEFWDDKSPMRIVVDNKHGIKTTLVQMPSRI